MSEFQIDDYVWYLDFFHRVVQVSKDGSKVKILEDFSPEDEAFWVGRNSIEKLTDAEIDELHGEEIPDYGDYSEESQP